MSGPEGGHMVLPGATSSFTPFSLPSPKRSLFAFGFQARFSGLRGNHSLVPRYTRHAWFSHLICEIKCDLAVARSNAIARSPRTVEEHRWALTVWLYAGDEVPIKRDEECGRFRNRNFSSVCHRHAGAQGCVLSSYYACIATLSETDVKAMLLRIQCALAATDSATLLRTRCALSGTDKGYAATRRRRRSTSPTSQTPRRSLANLHTRVANVHTRVS
eukprot:2498838-Rhodomonas_salina.1